MYLTCEKKQLPYLYGPKVKLSDFLKKYVSIYKESYFIATLKLNISTMKKEFSLL